MANPEHVEILLQGVEAWNRWRRERPGDEPDLSHFQVTQEQASSSIVYRSSPPGVRNVTVKIRPDSEAIQSGNSEEELFLSGELEGDAVIVDSQSKAKLRGVNFVGADLRYANLQGAILTGADFTGAKLYHTDLEDADLRNANMTGAKLGKANLNKAKLQHSHLTEAKLLGTSLVGANLYRAHIDNASLFSADLTRATLKEADIRFTILQRAILNDADVSEIKYNRHCKFKGIRATTCFGNHSFRRYAMDQDFLEEFRRDHPIIHFIWLVTCNCGRSMSLWAGWSVALAGLLTLIFHGLGQDSFALLSDPHGNEMLPWSWNTMCYYSVVTFTTLGFGDVTPLTWWAKFWVMAEVILGYIMLGGLISIFANKLARRSG